MAVRFLPAPEEHPSEPAPDRADLAEVIELRSLLRGPGWATVLEQAAASSSVEGVGEFGSSNESVGESGSSNEGVGESGSSTEVGDEFSGGSELGRLPGSEFGPGRNPGSASEREAVPGLDAGLHLVPGAGSGAEPERRSVNEDGVRLLARKARSSGELRADLLALGHDQHEVEDVIDEFERSHYLDDLGLARVLTEKLRDTKRASRTQIRLKLRERKLPDSAIEEALGELDTDEEFELLREAAENRAGKLGGLDRQTAERRLLGFLARRGWSGEPAMRAAREALDSLAGTPRRGGGRGGGSVRFR